MKETVEKFLKGELIGQTIQVPLKKLSGRIIDETRNTFEIITKNNQRKKITKAQKLIFKIDNKKIIVEGKLLQLKPEERIKLKIK
tara:strand:- start:123 stop:377 length:255 start_codon:yes stop_codon:yes gene_type:complete